MATYYCIHGEAFNGDGTAKTPATVAGGVGAFNDAVACLKGTEAAILDGDTVIFKTNHNGSDIFISDGTGDILIAGGIVTAYRTYIFDNGTHWVGESGVLTLEMTAQSSQLSTGHYCNIYCLSSHNFKSASGTGNTYAGSYYFGRGVYIGLHIERLYGYTNSIVPNTNSRSAYFEDLKITYGGNNYNGRSLVESPYGTNLTINGLTIELLNGAGTPVTNKPVPLFAQNGNGSELYVYNVKIIGGGSLTYLLNNPVNDPSTVTIIQGVEVDNIDIVFDYRPTGLKGSAHISGVSLNGSEDFGFAETHLGATADYLPWGNYPKLNAVLPDGVTKWSVRITPDEMIESLTTQLFAVSKLYDQPSAAKNVVMHMLINADFINPTLKDWWLTVKYIDDTNVRRVESTLDMGLSPALIPSDTNAAWTATTYATLNYNKHKLELTTQHPVKQDTVVHVTLFSTKAAPVAGRFYFIDPEIEMI